MATLVVSPSCSQEFICILPFIYRSNDFINHLEIQLAYFFLLTALFPTLKKKCIHIKNRKFQHKNSLTASVAFSHVIGLYF